MSLSPEQMRRIHGELGIAESSPKPKNKADTVPLPRIAETQPVPTVGGETLPIETQGMRDEVRYLETRQKEEMMGRIAQMQSTKREERMPGPRDAQFLDARSILEEVDRLEHEKDVRAAGLTGSLGTLNRLIEKIKNLFAGNKS